MIERDGWCYDPLLVMPIRDREGEIQKCDRQTDREIVSHTAVVQYLICAVSIHVQESHAS